MKVYHIYIKIEVICWQTNFMPVLGFEPEHGTMFGIFPIGYSHLTQMCDISIFKGRFTETIIG